MKISKNISMLLIILFLVFMGIGCNTTKPYYNQENRAVPPEYWINLCLNELVNSKGGVHSGLLLKPEKHQVYYEFKPKELKSMVLEAPHSKVLSHDFFTNYYYYKYADTDIKEEYYATIDNIDFDKIYTPFSEKKKIDVEMLNYFFTSTKSERLGMESEFEEIYMFSKPYFSEDNKYIFLLIFISSKYLDSSSENIYLFRKLEEGVELKYSLALWFS